MWPISTTHAQLYSCAIQIVWQSKEGILNWSTAIMLFLAWQLLSKNTQSAPKLQDIAPFLNDDTRGILEGVTKLSSPSATSEDKTGAILQMMTNPTVMNLAQNLFGQNNPSNGQNSTPVVDPFAIGAQSASPQTEPTSWQQPTTATVYTANNQTPTTNNPPQNDEGYTFDSPTERAKQFFAPIDPIATAEVKHKLCSFYDNWYLAK